MFKKTADRKTDDTGVYQLIIEKNSYFSKCLIQYYILFHGDGKPYLAFTKEASTQHNHLLSSDNPMLQT